MQCTKQTRFSRKPQGVVATTKLISRYLFSTIISFYQYCISPILGPRCRFYPSCSTYMKTAIHTFGITKGFYLGLRRFCRCHPWHPGGIDLVPERKPLKEKRYP